MRREESVGAKMVVGMAADRLAAVAAAARSWNPRVERMASTRDVLGKGGSDRVNAAAGGAVKMKAIVTMSNSSAVAVAIEELGVS